MPQSAEPFVAAGRGMLEQALNDVRGCIAGAPTLALNWRPAGADTNSIAVLAVHSLHSTSSWLSIALGAPLPERDRPAEFLATARDVAALLAVIEEIERDCIALLDGAAAGRLVRRARGAPPPRQRRPQARAGRLGLCACARASARARRSDAANASALGRGGRRVVSHP